jgi:hypothetical protein
MCSVEKKHLTAAFVIALSGMLKGFVETTHSGGNISSNIELHAVLTKHFIDMASH